MFSEKEMGTDTDIALKVQNITKDGQGRLIIKAGKLDDISEVYKSIDFEGAGGNCRSGKYAGNCRGRSIMSIFRKIQVRCRQEDLLARKYSSSR